MLDLNGQPIATAALVRYWSDGLDKLADPAYQGYVIKTPKSHSGWANLDIYQNYYPDQGKQGPWCWSPVGAADVVVGGGLPYKLHVSTFAVWQAVRRQTHADPPPPPPPPPPPGEVPLEMIRRNAWDILDIPFNPDAAIGRYAREHNLGVPLTGEFDVAGYRCQGFVNGIVHVVIGHWDQVSHTNW
ncbi:MAG TPA: hypothetical protein P5148_18160 [Anaerolineae bacterium]|nr:hypothetical protein [Anaerolineae bacterium]